MTTLATRTCSICDRSPIAARGWCWLHYASWRKYGDPLTTQRRYSGPKPWKPDRRLFVLELLQLEGGWWTIAGLALRLEAKEDSVERSLVRMRKAGLVESRTIPRWEWRAL